MNEQDNFAWEQTYDERVREAYRTVARHVYGARGLGDFAYRAFDYINGVFFAGRLPEPLILWDITSYGNCLGWARSPQDGPPIIKLHPSTVGSASERPPWGEKHLGYCFAFHVLIHETIHVGVNYLLGGYEKLPERKRYWSSHNNPLWINEVNRIAALMGLPANYSMKTFRRVPTGEVNAKGKPITRLEYASDGPNFERFPHETPGAADFYVKEQLPSRGTRSEALTSAMRRVSECCG